MKYCSLTLAGLLLSSVSLAQQAVVVPAQYSNRDAPSMRWLAGVTTERLRQQILVSPSQLTACVGKQISGMAFRRDVATTRARTGGKADLRIRLSTSPSPVTDPAGSLATNVGADEVLVFSGVVTVPNSPAVQVGSSLWIADNVVSLTFSTPFLYQGGVLCVDVTGAPVWNQRTKFWPLDAVVTGVRGSVTNVGSSGSPFLARVNAKGERITSYVDETGLVVGSSVVFSAQGGSGSVATLVLGIGLMSQPLDLAFLGAGGSFLYVNPVAALSSVFPLPLPSAAPGMGGIAQIGVDLPEDKSLLGGRVYAQWIDMGPPLNTSNALACQIASTSPAAEMSLVTGVSVNQIAPLVGTVEVGVGHVIKFAFH